MNPIYKIVLTGGPCGGKTTALVFILERLNSMCYKTLIAPEVPTQYILSGILPSELPPIQFQELIIHGQRNQEAEYVKAAKIYAQEKPTVIIYDRGLLDGAAFCTAEEWGEATKLAGLRPAQVRDINYDLIIHMVTAAEGAEKSYSLANNRARRETAEEARSADIRSQKAWIGHPKFRLIDNSTDFREKINRVTAEICKTIGLPAPIETERKFLVRPESTDLLVRKYHSCTVEIEQTYLLSPAGEERRLRKRTQADHTVYFHTKRKIIGKEERVEEDSIITEEAYLALLLQKDPNRNQIQKTRFCLLYQNQYLEIDRHINPKLLYDTVEIETTGAAMFPPELEIIEELIENT